MIGFKAHVYTHIHTCIHIAIDALTKQFTGDRLQSALIYTYMHAYIHIAMHALTKQFTGDLDFIGFNAVSRRLSGNFRFMPEAVRIYACMYTGMYPCMYVGVHPSMYV